MIRDQRFCLVWNICLKIPGKYKLLHIGIYEILQSLIVIMSTMERSPLMFIGQISGKIS